MTEIDLSRLPPPKAIEEFSFEAIFERKKSRLISLVPAPMRESLTAVLALESEPLTIDLQQQAYSEMLLRQRINEATAATMLALASGSDLDHLGAKVGLARKTIRPADPNAVPPVEARLETDQDFRRRIQLHPEKYAAAGPAAAYVAHALDADPDVADARAVRAQPGTVRVYIKSNSNNGAAPGKVVQTVQSYLSAEERRPLCDRVEVRAGTAKNVEIRYRVTFEQSLGKETVQQRQQHDLEAVIAENNRLGAKIALSKIIGALDVPGVRKIELISPTEDIECSDAEYPVITGIRAEEAV